jgi:hypothetical protein
VLYAPDDAEELPQAPDASRIRSNLRKMTKLYADFNRASARHATNRGDADPTEDQVDARIVRPEDDDYNYPKSGREPRVRRNEGNEYVTTRW